MILHWGFRIRHLYSKTDYIYAISRPEPIFDKSDIKKINPIMYEQNFERNVTLRYICADDFDVNEMVFDSFLLPEKEGTAFLLNCPKSKLMPIQTKKEMKLNLIPKDPSMM